MPKPTPGIEQPDGYLGSWCPHCGSDVRVDEDGLCASCGATAVGEGADEALRLLRAQSPKVAPGIEQRARVAWKEISMLVHAMPGDPRVDDAAAEIISAALTTADAGGYDRGRREERERVLRLAEPWDLISIVRKLVDAAGHLLDDHDCDAHGHEGIDAAKRGALAWLAAFEKDNSHD